MLQTLYKIGSRQLGIFKPAAKWAFYAVRFAPIERRMPILNTIPRSGTNRFKLFLANYLVLLRDQNRDSPVGYHEMMNTIFPNLRDEYIGGIKPYRRPSCSLLAPYGYTDFTHSHSTRFLEHYRGRMIFLYRNPLDHVISLFYYRYKYRSHRAHLFDHPRQIVDETLRGYARHFRFFDRPAIVRRTLRLTYEDMMQRPLDVFRSALEWWCIPVNDSILPLAVDRSDIRHVQAEEKRHGPIHAPEGFTGRFARSGAIAQWTEVFSDKDIQSARALLAEEGLDLDVLIRPTMEVKSHGRAP